MAIQCQALEMMRLIFLYLCIDVIWAMEVKVTVVTRKGPVIGQHATDGNYSTFFGIPYAKVDETNPFGASLEYTFDTPFKASDPKIQCPQVIRNEGGILQCLRLNIYVPNSRTNRKVPVLVWFHGGGFVIGSAGEYGGKYLIEHDIIVVTANYRLSPYGFLCLDDPRVPGNQGLKDQITALRWIKENIELFSGDASKVTVAGQSFGGGAVDLHVRNSTDLFDKAIIQSGSKYAQGMYSKGNRKAAIELAAHLGHNTTKNKDALKFLAAADIIDVIKASRDLKLQLVPCKIKEKKHKKMNDKPIMIGFNSKEAFGQYANKTDEFYANLGDVFYDTLKDIDVIKKDFVGKLSEIVKTFYLGGKIISKDAMLELSDFTSDFRLNYAVETTVNDYISHGLSKVYKYMFSYIGGSPYKNIPGVGAYHTEELQYLFEMTNQLQTDEQMMMRKRMTEMWANFVKHGNPTPETTILLPVHWAAVTDQSSRPYLNIDVELEMRNYVYHERISFWQLIRGFYHNKKKQ